MRSFQVLEEMNIRKSPNGRKIGIVPQGEVIYGENILEKDGVLWLQTEYGGRKGFVAVAPKIYTKEITTQGTEASADIFTNIETLTQAYQILEEKIAKIRALLKDF